MYKPLLRKAVSGLARGLDRAFTGTALNPPRRFVRPSQAERLDHAGRMRALRLIGSFYDRPEFLSCENELFPRPRAIAPEVTRVRAFGGHGDVLDLSWASEFEPLWSRQALAQHLSSLPEAHKAELGLLPGAEALAAQGFDRSGELRDKYMRALANRTAHARWFRHAGSARPAVVLIHGYMAGNYLIEERVWPVKRIFDSGLDVVLTVLPLHGPRRAQARGYLPPAFPSSDPRFTIEGFRQLVFDHRALFDHLQRCGVRDLGLMGMSLGGYSAALLATLERMLSFAVFLVPLAAIEDFAYRSGRMLGHATEQLAQRDALQRAQRMISPFTRAPQLPAARVVSVAGESDLVTGVEQARKLSQHFGGQLTLFHGGHLLHAGREEAFAPVWRLLGEFAAGALRRQE
jgi:pimeloyl-ACP methyl ester carboxylesterase